MSNKSSTEKTLEVDELFGRLTDLVSPPVQEVTVPLVKRPTTPGDVDRSINQTIYGLLSKEALTLNEIALLSALMKGRKK